MSRTLLWITCNDTSYVLSVSCWQVSPSLGRVGSSSVPNHSPACQPTSGRIKMARNTKRHTLINLKVSFVHFVIDVVNVV